MYKLALLFVILIPSLTEDGQPVFECPRAVAFADSASLTCSNFQESGSLRKPPDDDVAVCVSNNCDIKDERINITFIEDNTLILTVREIDKEDEGEWTCQSGTSGKCSLKVYKLPSCEISSTSSTNDLYLGQDLPLNINLTDYYCTNSIVWNLGIGGKHQNVTVFREFEETENLTSRIVTYSPTVTSSLTGSVELTFNCNDETYDVSCSGVKGLKFQSLQSGSESVLTMPIVVTVIVLVIAIAIGIFIFCWSKYTRSTNKDLPYSDVFDTVPQRQNRFKVTTNDTYTEVKDITGSPKRGHFETDDVKGSQRELVDFREVADQEGNLKDKSRPRSEC